MADNQPSHFVFPRWTNYLLPVLVIAVLGGGLYVPVVLGFGLSPKTLNMGYAPSQPVEYSHELHVGELGLDCRYCHTTVEKAPFAAIPHTQVCINCHNPDATAAGIRKGSEKLAPVHESYRTGMPIEWVKVHDNPDFVYFNHSAHVNSGVGCYSCHGRVDKMKVVYQARPLSMSWCLDCHRAPEKHLRPADQVTSMTYHTGVSPDDIQAREGETPAEAQLRVGLELKKSAYDIHDTTYMTSCSTCHR